MNSSNYEVFKDCLSSALLNIYSSSLIITTTNNNSGTGAAKKRAVRQQRRQRQRRERDGSSQNATGGFLLADVVDDDDGGDVLLVVDIGSSGERDGEELGDFIEFLSSEIFNALPTEARTLSYSVLQQENHRRGKKEMADKYAHPLPPPTREELVHAIPPSVTDTLTAYSLISPSAEPNLTSTFLTSILDNYVATVTAAPPAWHSTRTPACEICGRDWIPLSYHHLIPKAVHAKALKRGWHEEHMLNKVAWLCRACHSFVHRMASNEELARQWHEIERILEREDVRRWRNWVGSVRWKKR